MRWLLLASVGAALTVLALKAFIGEETTKQLYEDSRKTRVRKLWRHGEVFTDTELEV